MSITISQIHSLWLRCDQKLLQEVQCFKLSHYKRELSVSDIKKKQVMTNSFSVVPQSNIRYKRNIKEPCGLATSRIIEMRWGWGQVVGCIPCTSIPNFRPKGDKNHNPFKTFNKFVLLEEMQITTFH